MDVRSAVTIKELISPLMEPPNMIPNKEMEVPTYASGLMGYVCIWGRLVVPSMIAAPELVDYMIAGCGRYLG
jgi:hypothetical protein